jgi:hypothetical protein
MATFIRKTTATGQTIHPEWLIELTPGATEARDEWRRLAAEAAPLQAAVKAAIKAAVPLGRWVGTGPGDAQYVPAVGVSTADFEAAQKTKADAEAAVKAANRRTAAAYVKFERLMAGSGDVVSAEARRAAAAEYAVKMQADLERAWAAFTEALDAREEAYHYAGQPGRSWQTRNGAGSDPARALGDARALLDVVVTKFDTGAATAAGNGEDVDSSAAYEAEMARVSAARVGRDQASERRSSGGFA